MPYIYKYVNRRTEEPVYVGISRDYNTLIRRFVQHEHDYWYVEGDWDIYYSEVATQNDAEALEGHYIALYETYKYYNKAKVGWGLSSFAPEVVWEKYKDWNGKRYQDVLKDQRKAAEAKMWELLREIDRIKTAQEHLRDEFYRIANEEDKLKRKAVRAWLWRNYTWNREEWRKMKSANAEERLNLYKEACEAAQPDNVTYYFRNAAELATTLDDLRRNDYSDDAVIMREFDRAGGGLYE